MRTGLDLVALAQRITEDEAKKKDILAPTDRLAFLDDDQGIRLVVAGDHEPHEIKQTAHDQIADRLNIPRKYYGKMMAESPMLLRQNVNHWFGAKAEKRMVRLMDGKVRAFLSDSYRPYDNYLVAEAVLPALQEANLQVLSAEVTESRMYIKVANERSTTEVKKGDVVQFGVVISNSEIGHGSVRFEEFMYRLVCLNGAIVGQSMRKNHVGRALGSGDEVDGDFYKRDTVIADAHAFQLKLRDMVQNSFNPSRWSVLAEQMQLGALRVITKPTVDLIEDVTKRYQLNDRESTGVLENLIRNNDMTQWGLGNAITQVANEDFLSYDRIVELERIGGDVFAMTGREFTGIATV